MKRLLIATTNQAKIAEYKKYLSDIFIEIVTLADISITQKPEENGKTLEENALIKARFYFKLSGIPTISDDGGFEIDALNGFPGVRSHRFVNSDREDTDEEIITEIIKRMGHIPLENREAQMNLTIALVTLNGKEYTVKDTTRGIVPFKPSHIRNDHFPYRSLLYFPEVKKFYSELNEIEMEKYNHRKRAIEKMKQILFKS